jgi:hypothetical protein
MRRVMTIVSATAVACGLSAMLAAQQGQQTKVGGGTTYTINTQPGPTAWQIIFGTRKTRDQCGIPHQSDLELARAPMTVGKTKSPVEQVTFSIDSTAAGGTLRLEWGSTSVNVPFKVG